MAATLTLRVYTGTNAGTESAAEDAIALLSVDTASEDPDDGEVVAGTNSFEKWLRVKIDDDGSSSFTNFWIERSGDLPDGVAIKMGVTDDAVTPSAATSTVALTTMADGRRYVFDANVYDESGQYTRYVVIQEVVGAGVSAGDIEQQVFTIGYAQG